MSDEETEPAAGPFSTRSFRIAALFLLACGAAAVLIAVIGTPAIRVDTTAAVPAATTSTPAAASPTTPSPTAVPRPAAATPEPDLLADTSSVCGLGSGDQGIPTAAPAATWQILGGRVAAPASATFGPAVVSPEGIGGCFAHSPTGALFAMMQSVALTSAPPDQLSQVAVVTQRGSRSNFYDTALAEAQQEDKSAVSAMPADSSTLVKQALLGYTFIDYTPDRATIAVAVGIGDPSRPGSYQPSMFTGVVVWENGDWRFVYSAQTAGSMAPILSQGQYTRWAA